jgi:hypothetical protein
VSEILVPALLYDRQPRDFAAILAWSLEKMVCPAGLSGDGVLVAILVGIASAVAVVVATIMQLVKREPFRLGAFMARVIWLLVILVPVMVVLLFGLLAYMFRYG